MRGSLICQWIDSSVILSVPLLKLMLCVFRAKFAVVLIFKRSRKESEQKVMKTSGKWISLLQKTYKIKKSKQISMIDRLDDRSWPNSPAFSLAITQKSTKKFNFQQGRNGYFRSVFFAEIPMIESQYHRAQWWKQLQFQFCCIEYSFMYYFTKKTIKLQIEQWKSMFARFHDVHNVITTKIHSNSLTNYIRVLFITRRMQRK